VKTPYEEMGKINKTEKCNANESNWIKYCFAERKSTNVISETYKIENSILNNAQINKNQEIIEGNEKGNVLKESETFKKSENNIKTDFCEKFFDKIDVNIKQRANEQNSSKICDNNVENTENILKVTSFDSTLQINDLWKGEESFWNSNSNLESSPKVDMSNVFGGEIDIDKIISEQS